MGKWTDKLYITHSEWSGEVGQHSASAGTTGKTGSKGFKRLPFYCCSLSLQPFEHPVCTPDGVIFDLVHIIPYIKKYGTNPVTGEKLTTKQLIKLNFFKNDKDEYYCPVTFKVFSDHTAIAAIKTTGNVFAYDTIERLNVKAKYMKDLLTDEPFTKKDIIMIQDPHNLDKRNMSQFHYVKNDLKVEREKRKPINNINVSGLGGSTGRVLAKLQEKEKSSSPSADEKGSADEATKVAKRAPTDLNTPHFQQPKKAATPYNAANFSTGRAAASFTSSVMAPVTVNEAALIDEDSFMYKHIKQKAYARIVTNLGNINIELHCDRTPRTCHNFILLAKSGYYEGVRFHRSIRNFMIQGGDPTGTGSGGESYWKQPFPDEIKPNLKHDDRGILSMANKGKNTNGSQFFITYRPCQHLDGKHTVFGRVVGGLEVLNKMEVIPTDEGDHPERDIRIREVSVFVDPFEQYQTRLKRKLEHQANEETETAEREQARAKKDSMGWFGPNVNKKKASVAGGGGAGVGVGKYLAATANKNSPSSTRSASPLDVSEPDDVAPTPPKVAIKKATPSYGNFDNF
ncbi:peptidyl-prolyl cis-trans isomerase-like 2 [Syncephalastrum racemosum]|uniref:Peptidyl-prolyl cis-trans isomerase-like 2 n=1 Tax=Syncephalastrum racemosum TaxID=13706 RepID=A0A1X2HAJ2_SYNRA|nr:peptidyl-prolyl cis-trans isomerase-like 2 [Syncephalastrum racemosum]